MVLPVFPLKIVCRHCEYHTVLYPLQGKYNFSHCPRCQEDAWKYRHATLTDKLKRPAAWLRGRWLQPHH